jgi:hypothetical protein
LYSGDCQIFDYIKIYKFLFSLLIMGKLFKRVLAPLILILAGMFFFSPKSAKSQENSHDYYVFGGGGVFSGAEESMKDIYGRFFRVEGGIGRYTNKGLAELLLAYSRKEGTPYVYSEGDIEYTAGSEMSIVEVHPRLGFFPGRGGDFTPYFKIGVPITFMREKIEADFYTPTDSGHIEEEGERQGIGISAAFGLDLVLNKQENGNLSAYAEATGSYIPIETDWGEKVNAGGLSVTAGLKKFF